ncbi:hypothetical protein XMA121_000132 [Marinobacterium sp. xm-a-121]|uniref:glycosyltransferase n=1 Tax=unclassified Marinobacterium TaxID=2644139 RepID=UPI0015688EBA|nr:MULTISPECIES: glycosyltransferase [unclassified Marinobacterium]NRP37547.1 hypothetical protein [Marinobacterium sp. xm-a-121]NRP99891.1 hypothetical protein [Marinobacterium sp. xm-v-233]
MNIVYLTWGETPRSYGVFGSQVIRQFVETAKLDKKLICSFVSAVPIIHSGIVREGLAYRDEIKKVKGLLGNIPFHWLPVYCPQNFVNSSELTFKYMHFGAHRGLKSLLIKLRADVVHCRSYHAAWAAVSVKKRYNLNYRIIFDGRSLWPEEMALKGKVSQSAGYEHLKDIEKQIIAASDKVIAVSQTMNDYFSQLCPAEKVETVFLSSDTERLTPSEFVAKSPSAIKFCYLGALYKGGWHDPDELLNLFSHLRQTCQGAKLKIITTSSHRALRQVFEGPVLDDIEFTSTKSLEELRRELADVDFGLMSYFKPESELQITLGKMVMAVKTAEYLAAGLPLIVNNACGGAAAIVNDYDLGISYNSNSFEQLTRERIERLLSVKHKKRISEAAVGLFDYKNHAQQYSDIYRQCYR